MLEPVLIIWFAAAGAVVGSFLNVVIYRLPLGKSIVSPPSHCPKCGHRIRFYDNLPILGWFLLNGRCRDCKQPISVRYPLIEAISCVIVGSFAVLLFNPNLEFVRPVLENSHYIGENKEIAIQFVLVPLTMFQIVVRILWLSALHLLLLTFGMIDWDRQAFSQKTLASLIFPFLLAGFFLSFLFPVPFFSFWPFETVIASCRHWPDLATDGIAGGTDVLFGVIFAGVAALGTSRVLYQSNQWLCFYSFLLLGIFLGWQLAAIVFVTSLAFHGIVLFVFQRSNLVLSLAAASFVVNVIVLYH